MTGVRSDPIVRLAHVVGDFSNPFYDEERQRDVWNEASAFGLQLLLWTSMLAATGTVWAVGAPAVPYVCGAVALVGLVCGLTIAYAQRLGIELTGTERMLRWRLLPYLGLLAALGAGLVRAGAGDFSTSFATGLLGGAGVAVLVLALRLRRTT